MGQRDGYDLFYGPHLTKTDFFLSLFDDQRPKLTKSYDIVVN